MAENELQKVEKIQSPIMKLAEMQADGKIDAAGLKQMMELQFMYEENEAKKAYTVAMAAFKADPPKIMKDKTVSYGQTSYKHASLANVTSTINKALSVHGLSAAWFTEQVESLVKITCTVTHVLGHSENTSLSAPPDDSGSKNVIQQIASTVSYLERYTILAITGLATDDMDDDGNAGGKKAPSQFTPPNKAEQIVIALICEQLETHAPQGMRVDDTKVIAIIWEVSGKYASNSKSVDQAVQWFIDSGRQEIFIPDNRSDFEKQHDMPGDEDSAPDTPEVLYECKECGFKHETPKDAAECVH